MIRYFAIASSLLLFVVGCGESSRLTNKTQTDPQPVIAKKESEFDKAKVNVEDARIQSRVAKSSGDWENVAAQLKFAIKQTQGHISTLPTSDKSYDAVQQKYKEYTKEYQIALAKVAELEQAKVDNAEKLTISLSSQRIDDCLARENCTFAIVGAGVPDTQMGFWVLRREWDTFTLSDKNALKARLNGYLKEMRDDPERMVQDQVIGAGIPSSAPAFPRFVENVRNAKSWIVFIPVRESESGGLITDNPITDF